MKALYILPFLLVIGLRFPLDVEAQQDAPREDESIAPAAAAADEPKQNLSDQTSSFWMDQKLRISKELLTALARADFDMLGKNAELLRGLNRIETMARRSPEGYRDELKLFNMANIALIRAAKEENLEAATLAFNRLTVSCVSCHQHLRETK